MDTLPAQPLDTATLLHGLTGTCPCFHCIYLAPPGNLQPGLNLPLAVELEVAKRIQDFPPRPVCFADPQVRLEG